MKKHPTNPPHLKSNRSPSPNPPLPNPLYLKSNRHPPPPNKKHQQHLPHFIWKATPPPHHLKSNRPPKKRQQHLPHFVWKATPPPPPPSNTQPTSPEKEQICPPPKKKTPSNTQPTSFEKQPPPPNLFPPDTSGWQLTWLERRMRRTRAGMRASARLRLYSWGWVSEVSSAGSSQPSTVALARRSRPASSRPADTVATQVSRKLSSTWRQANSSKVTHHLDLWSEGHGSSPQQFFFFFSLPESSFCANSYFSFRFYFSIRPPGDFLCATAITCGRAPHVIATAHKNPPHSTKSADGRL